MDFAKKNTITKLSLLAAGSLALLAMTGCAPVNHDTPEPTTEQTSSSSTEATGAHLSVASSFEKSSDWSLIKESDRTKGSDTQIHNIRWDTGSKLLTVDDIKALFKENNYTVSECYEQITNCVGTAQVDRTSVDVSISANAFYNSKNNGLDHNEVALETSSTK